MWGISSAAEEGNALDEVMKWKTEALVKAVE